MEPAGPLPEYGLRLGSDGCSRKRGPQAPGAAIRGGWRYLTDATERDRFARTGAQVTSRTPKW